MIANDPTLKSVLPVPGLYGLVVCGGESKRMGADKSMLVYHKKPQRYHLYDMLKPVCEKVFISCNSEQANEVDEGYEVIVDLPPCKQIGPMAAIVSAVIHYPKNNFLMVGCDYPFLTASELYSFICSVNEDGCAAFYNDIEQLYDPLLAWYHHEANHRLMKRYATGQYSLQQFLESEQASKYHPSNRHCIRSIDTRHDYVKAKKSIDLNPEWI